MNAEKLKAKIVEKNTTIECVAQAANINRSTFYRKLKGENKGFTVGEVRAIVSFLGLSGNEAHSIFFG